MILNICHMYPDLLNAYGDYGNTMILKYRAKARNIEVNVHHLSLNQDFNIELYDIVILGGGQSYEQQIVKDDLTKNKAIAFNEYVNMNKTALFISGGYQLAGEYYINEKGTKEDGLGILPIHTKAGDRRMTGDIVIQSGEHKYAGFENHSGRTYISGLEPLGTVIFGFGNNGEDGTEGCVFKNTFSTYMHGPFLSKNPEMADRIIKTALNLKHENAALAPLDDSLEHSAKAVILERASLSAAIKLTQTS